MVQIRVITAPFHAGAYGVRVGAGPLRLLDDGLIASLEGDGHTVRVEEIESVEEFEGEIGKTFEIKRRVADRVRAARSEQAFPIVLAGNCNVEVGVWSGIAKRDVGLLWFDAHPDFDTPDQHLSGYLDGMGVATMAGQCWRGLSSTIPGFEPFPLDQLLYCGIRDFSPAQWDKVRDSGVRAVAGRLDGSTNYGEGLAQHMADYRHGEIMIHLDVDCLDISVGMANEYAAAGGLSAEALDACLETAGAAARPISLTIASFNPNLDGAGRISAAAIRAACAVAAAA